MFLKNRLKLPAKTHLMFFISFLPQMTDIQKKSVDAVLSSMYPDLICKKS